MFFEKIYKNLLTYWLTQSILFLADKKKGVAMTEKKLGRPASENSMKDRITIRLDKECLNTLQNYCKKNNCTQADAIRKAIILLK